MSKYKHGEEVQVKPSVGGGNIKDAYIVGVTVVESDDAAKEFNAPIGTIFYTVEFSDGSDALVPETAVQPSKKDQ